MKIEDITQKRLNELLSYNEKTGEFTWVNPTSRRVAKNTKAIGKNDQGYVIINIDNRPYRAHRLVWLYKTGEFPTNGIDHKNGIKSDNRFENLRDVSQSDNIRNIRLRSDNISGYHGVSKRKDYDAWKVRIHVDGKEKTIGTFKNFDDAVMARKAAEKKYGYFENHGRSS